MLPWGVLCPNPQPDEGLWPVDRTQTPGTADGRCGDLVETIGFPRDAAAERLRAPGDFAVREKEEEKRRRQERRGKENRHRSAKTKKKICTGPKQGQHRESAG